MSATTDNIMNRVIDWVNNRLRVDATLSQSANIIGKVGIDQVTANANNVNVLANGDALLIPTKFVDVSTVTISTIATVWTPATGKKFRLMGGSFSVSAACSVLFEDNANPNTVIRTPKLAADTPYAFDLGNGVLSATINNVLKATASASATITGHLYGREE